MMRNFWVCDGCGVEWEVFDGTGSCEVSVLFPNVFDKTKKEREFCSARCASEWLSNLADEAGEE